MKKQKFLSAVAFCLLLGAMWSCKYNSTETAVKEENGISATTLKQISDLGFSTKNVQKTDGGYLVENDILLSEENLTEAQTGAKLKIAETEQYRTTNIVKGLPRVVTISVTNLPKVYSDAANEMISRYNALNLRLTFKRATGTAKGTIDLIGFNKGYNADGSVTLGSSGFPTSSGQPYNQIKMNTNVLAYGPNPELYYLASVIQHEVGHCIGFRHTDYMNRSFSCTFLSPNDPRNNEGQSGDGAVLIPGTPSTPDKASFMLACAPSDGSSRSFNANDRIAMNYLYK